MANPYQSQMNQYKRMKFETASPEMLILMLYDGAIKNITQAKAIISDPTQIEVCSNSLIKAQNIITELMVSLNFDIGGEIAKNLFNIYEYVNYTLAQANINKNDDNLDVVLQMLKDLRGTWQEVIKINKEKYPNGIPEPAPTPKAETAPQAPAGSQASVTNPTPPVVNQEQPSPESTVENLESSQSEAVLSTPATYDDPALAAKHQSAADRAKVQTNRFRQIYGKNSPRKV